MGELAAAVTTRRGDLDGDDDRPKALCARVDRRASKALLGFSPHVWNYAEPAWREYKSARAYCDLLRAEGFAVEEGSGEMPTAFAARWGKSGPALGAYAE
jgi:aminobenzoyl-glutamate utilization protein B